MTWIARVGWVTFCKLGVLDGLPSAPGSSSDNSVNEIFWGDSLTMQTVSVGKVKSWQVENQTGLTYDKSINTSASLMGSCMLRRNMGLMTFFTTHTNTMIICLALLQSMSWHQQAILSVVWHCHLLLPGKKCLWRMPRDSPCDKEVFLDWKRSRLTTPTLTLSPEEGGGIRQHGPCSLI